MKKIIIPLLCVLLLLSGCAAPAEDAESEIHFARSLTDSLGNTAELPEDPNVVALYGSLAQCWLLSGGKLAGVTEDAAEEHGVEVNEDTVLVGSVKEPSLEQVASLSPDYVLLSADLTAHAQLDAALSDMQIPHGYFRMDTFEDYSAIMQSFCALNDKSNARYTEYVEKPAERIKQIRTEAAALKDGEAPRVLLLRAYSTGVKAKKDDNLAGVMLDELGAHNIAYDSPSLLEELSAEKIIVEDPDFIFVLTMGSAESAKAYMTESIESNPAWSALSAVENGRYIFLPKDLFHYKPLNRWDESYAYLADLLLGKTE